MDTVSQEKRRAIMRAIRRENTDPEQRLAKVFDERAVAYTQNAADLPGKPDFYIPELDLVVFVHGCFWHGHEKCRKGTARPKTNVDFWAEKISRNRRRDSRVARKIRVMGLSVYVVWECELLKGKVPARLVSRMGFANE